MLRVSAFSGVFIIADTKKITSHEDQKEHRDQRLRIHFQP